MVSNPVDEARSTAIEQLEQLGLSSYAGQTFVALVTLGVGTAKEVSEISAVPRTRVYDAVEELRDHGLVDVKQSSPKEFWAVSSDSTGRKFEREIDHRTTVLTDALEQLEPVTRREKQKGVWTVDGHESVTDRVIEFIERADDEIVYMTVEDLLTDDIIDALRDAAGRDVTITLGGVSNDVEARVREQIPGANLFDSLWMWSDTPAGRLIMVDQRQTLVSVLVNGTDAAPNDPREETAIWGSGETNSLVVVLKAIFTWRLENPDR